MAFGLFSCECPRCQAALSIWSLLRTRKILGHLALVETVTCSTCGARVRIAGTWGTQNKKAFVVGLPAAALWVTLSLAFPQASLLFLIVFVALVNPLVVRVLGLEIAQ